MFEALSFGLESLLRSRKFLTALLDAIVATIVLVLTQLLAPAQMEFVVKLIAMWQPIILLVIAAWTVEDAVAKWAAGRALGKKR
jgi:formate/nitrite transporter FocA (FNT family)